ncbi:MULTISPECIES: pilus assembly protein TadG-related protein [unclassified Streptomyces]|uniref:pilus assembly protein TadG-related protein n=1 Tax=unclassified Streptomyces TaxID=2593676 RepID=UPI002E3732C5|nr:MULTISPECIES: pilus assembly protein TadG-related protein [unclassified Streptomyces]WUC64874.1 pilus assembly protein TadG-related protein [Streptomyces sp. NBC_00539]
MAARRVRDRDRGQAFPIYVVMVAGLLFAALAFFVIGQAGVTRSDAQGAADAAALAAAQKARDTLVPGVVLTDLQPKDWEKLVLGNLFDPAGACGEATSFATRNDASATCTSSGLSFTVKVQTNGTVGTSVIPGTESMHGTAHATALITPRCHLGASAAPGAPQSPVDSGVLNSGPVKIECKGGVELSFEPSKPDPWHVLARKLFDVRLTD